ncbi:N-acetylglucosamine kinase [Acrocarpospora macrocephala]|uniref:N-acetylglucosamine kinase n=1 Tax=Acrocarpospora macrocephala TaxID=150177 RepID=A0A5M3WD73_9ACTN|nr:BadF/BadG/BcrA/BcrD ATPase family protein [Acrocarpospora macrocephala]GES06776.1 N-acetylglucosamine kinase [Acrocarpospora macrocephala]
MPEYVIGVDGGNSKTDVVILTTSGRLLARHRGPGISSPLIDLAAWRQRLATVVNEARQLAGVPADTRARCAAYFLANVDLPIERRIARRELERAGQAEVTVVQNDTVAVLRAGAGRPWGIAVTAGAGINAIGVHPSARVARFLSLGDYAGDSGGGQNTGMLGLRAAVRHRDGRGPATVLSTTVPAHYGLRRPEDVAVAVHRGIIRYDELHVLAPLVFAAARAGDAVATRIIAGFADEVVTMVNALVRRLRLTRSDVEVVLGGGTLQSADGLPLDRVTDGILARAPAAQVTVLRVPPVFGAAVEAFDRIGVDASTLAEVKDTFTGSASD